MIAQEVTIKRMGRPAGSLGPAEALITARVRRLIDLAHEGNVNEASKVSGVPSPTLRRLYRGTNINPEFKTLDRLAQAYGFHAGWFTDPAQHDGVPLGGLTVVLTAADAPVGFGGGREIDFPWASWPLPDVFRRLAQYAQAHPEFVATALGGYADPPLVASDDVEGLVALMLVRPFDDADRLHGRVVGTTTSIPAFDNGPEATDVVRQMRQLGLYWQRALNNMLGDLK